MCLAGASGAGADLLKALPHDDLRAYFVWVPMLPGDNLEAAASNAELLAVERARHYWDGERHLSRHLGERLQVGLAWDVYLAYGGGATDIERPAFWMHQLGVTHAPRLDAAEFRRRVEALLGQPTEGQA